MHLPRPATCLLAIAVALPASAHARPAYGHHLRHARAVAATPPRTPGCTLTPYGGFSCYDDAGNPYDPDIIGGLNHVGDGGPAANF